MEATWIKLSVRGKKVRLADWVNAVSYIVDFS